MSAISMGSAYLKRTLPQPVWRLLRATATAAITPIRFSRRTGHWRSSLKNASCAADGSPTPWYTYPANDFLAQRRFDAKRILEFGGGQSTLWWAARAQSVITIEEDSGLV